MTGIATELKPGILGPGLGWLHFLFGDGLGATTSWSVGLRTHYLTFLEQKGHLTKSTVLRGSLWKAAP